MTNVYVGATLTMALASAGRDLAVDGATNAKRISGAIQTWSVIRANAM